MAVRRGIAACGCFGGGTFFALRLKRGNCLCGPSDKGHSGGMITRHFLTLPAAVTGGAPRKVHYRKCGTGPALLLVHQSPRNSGEFAALMAKWSQHFTCIAPDTPGFGQSEPLTGEPEIEDFADALAAFIGHLGIAGCPAYGFHSGGVILTFVAKRHPSLLSGVATGGYGMWTEQERSIFGERYVPAFKASDYGEHMVWLWSRIQEQSWFFPWFDIRDEARLKYPHYTAAQTQEIVMEMLDSGEAYAHGYAAVLRAPREIPAPGDPTPPVLITAYNGDPLQDHIDRLGPLPPAWQARKVATPDDHIAQSLAFLLDCASADCPPLAENDDEGFIKVGEADLHWRGQRGAAVLRLHGPGAEMAAVAEGELAIDVPAHGLSDDHPLMAQAVSQAASALGAASVDWPDLPAGDPDRLYPDLAPDTYGSHLIKAWAAARRSALFSPWYDASPEAAIAVDAGAIQPDVIAARARALLRAGPAARRWHAELEEVLANIAG